MSHGLTIVGIDPGISGGLACLQVPHGEPATLRDISRTHVRKLPQIGKTVINPVLLMNWLKFMSPDIILIERQNPRPGNSAMTTHSSGTGYGILLATVLLSCPLAKLIMPTPAAWKRMVGLPKGATKAMSIELARSLYPEGEHMWKFKTADGPAEASLLCRYAQLKMAKGAL